MFLCHFFDHADFNPRSHERSDGVTTSQQMAQSISIHAPTRGATKAQNYLKCYYIISIHAPTRGATIIDGRDAERLSISIHAPTRGATGIP